MNTPTDIDTQLAAILGAIAIEPPHAFQFAGMHFAGGDQESAIRTLRDVLYQHAYSNPFRGLIAKSQAAASGSLLPELSAVNAGRPHWESGWQIYHVHSSGCIMAQKNEIGRTFWPGEFVTRDGPGVGPRLNGRVDVFFATESLQMQPGFYFALAETVGPDPESTDLIRFYWNINPDGAIALTGAITRALNRFQVPFRFKCLGDRGAYGRLDAAVLFTNRRYFRIVADLIAPIRKELAGYLQPETPLFAKPLAPGLGFAEDPGDGGSFGMHRCRLLAEAIWKTRSIEEVTSVFQLHGLSLEQPYLNGGSVDQYELR